MVFYQDHPENYRCETPWHLKLFRLLLDNIIQGTNIAVHFQKVVNSSVAQLVRASDC
jgi:hypothetical protein